jgi:hypothetical protein
MSPQGVMFRKRVSYSLGLSPIKGQEFNLGTQSGSRDYIPSLSLGITKDSVFFPKLVSQPATKPGLYVSSRDSQGRLEYKKPQNRDGPCGLMGDLITS